VQNLGTHGGRLQKLRELIKKLMALTLILALSAPTQAHASASPHGKYHGVLPDAYYDQLAQCETGGNWQHSTHSYTGGLGINRATWRNWSNTSSAKGLTPRQQVKVADAIAFKSHINLDGRKVWRVGPWGWGCLKREETLQRFICQSRHTLVVRWKRNCGKVHTNGNINRRTNRQIN
jgi:resuscitation-promoting factor RpfA